MSFNRFDREQFFNETVLPTIACEPEYAKESKVPNFYGYIPVLNLDDTEHFVFMPCRLGYYPLSRTVEVAHVEIQATAGLPKYLAFSELSIPGNRPFDAIAAGRQGTYTVAGLRDAESSIWHQLPADDRTNRGILEVIRKKVHHRVYQRHLTKNLS